MAVSPRRHLAGLGRAEHGGFNDRERLSLGLGSLPVLDFSASTNPSGPPPAVLEAFQHADVSRYPDPEALELREAIASRHRVPPACVLAGNGSVEIIWLAAMAYLEPGRRAMVLGPTFGEYEAAARAAGAEVLEVRAKEEDGFIHDLATLGPAVATFLCNPNNPTGVLLPAAVIRAAAQRHPDTLFVVDEAYLPFAPSSQSCLDTGLMDNMLVLRSMTKDCGIPGLRLGYGVGPRPVIEALRAVQPPWTVNAPAQAAGIAALGSDEYVRECARSIEAAREYLVAGLRGLGLTVLDGWANFILVRAGDGAALRRTLLFEGCCVRDCASFGLPEYVRVGVRTMVECEALVAAVRRVLGGGASPTTSLPVPGPAALRPTSAGSAGILPARAAGVSPAPSDARWHSRGYLPHLEQPGLIQMVTFRLADALPRSVLEDSLAAASAARADAKARQIEEMLDRGLGSCLLRDPVLASAVEQALLAFDGSRYRLLAWTIMPNHVHVLFEPTPGYPLSRIVQSWKSFTAKEANRRMARRGRVWQPEYFDRAIRNERHLSAAVRYIDANAVNAGLVESPEEWRFSSASSAAGETPAAHVGKMPALPDERW